MGLGIYYAAWIYAIQFLIRITTAHHADSPIAQGLSFGF